MLDRPRYASAGRVDYIVWRYIPQYAGQSKSQSNTIVSGRSRDDLSSLFLHGEANFIGQSPLWRSLNTAT